MFIAPVCVTSISVLLFVVFLYTRYYPQPVVDFFKVLVLIITPQNSLGVQHSVVIYVNGSCSWSVTSVTKVLAEWFLGVIKYIKERSANTVMILKAWLSVKGLKVVRNISKVFYSWASKLKSIIRASINLLGGSSASSLLYFKINQLIQLSSLFLDLLYSSQVYLIDQHPSLPYIKHFWLVYLWGYIFIQRLLWGLQVELIQYRCCWWQWWSIKQVSKLICGY